MLFLLSVNSEWEYIFKKLHICFSASKFFLFFILHYLILVFFVLNFFLCKEMFFIQDISELYPEVVSLKQLELQWEVGAQIMVKVQGHPAGTYLLKLFQLEELAGIHQIFLFLFPIYLTDLPIYFCYNCVPKMQLNLDIFSTNVLL